MTSGNMELRRILNQEDIVIILVVLCRHCLRFFGTSCHYPSIDSNGMIMSRTDRKGTAECGSRGGVGEFGKERACAHYEYQSVN